MQLLTLKGLSSNLEIDIDLQLLDEILGWYVVDAPREKRSLPKFLAVMKIHEKIHELFQAESEAKQRAIDDNFNKHIAGKFIGDSLADFAMEDE